MLRLNCKIFHTAVRGNIKATGDFLYLKGSTSIYSVLFLNLVGQMPLPSQASQSQHSIQVKLCPFRDRGHPCPAPWVPASAEAHRSINLGTWVTPQGCPAADAVGRAERPLQRQLCYSLPLWPRAQDELRCFTGETGISCLLSSHFPFFFIGFWWFPHWAGVRREKKGGGEGNKEAHQILAFFHS